MEKRMAMKECLGTDENLLTRCFRWCTKDCKILDDYFDDSYGVWFNLEDCLLLLIFIKLVSAFEDLSDKNFSILNQKIASMRNKSVIAIYRICRSNGVRSGNVVMYIGKDGDSVLLCTDTYGSSDVASALDILEKNGFKQKDIDLDIDFKKIADGAIILDASKVYAVAGVSTPRDVWGPFIIIDVL